MVCSRGMVPLVDPGRAGGTYRRADDSSDPAIDGCDRSLSRCVTGVTGVVCVTDGSECGPTAESDNSAAEARPARCTHVWWSAGDLMVV